MNARKSTPLAIGACIVLGLAAGPAAHAEDVFANYSAQERDTLSSAYARCTAYFAYAWKGLERAGRNEVAKTYRDQAALAFDTSVQLASASHAPAVARKIAETRTSHYTEAIAAEIGSDFSRFAAVAARYSKPCISAVAEPDKFARAYLLHPDAQ